MTPYNIKVTDAKRFKFENGKYVSMYSILSPTTSVRKNFIGS